MANKTKIEWTEATWNPITGCAKVSQGCKHCYAERDWARLSANPATSYYGRDFTDVQCHADRLDQPIRWKKPRQIFVNSMSDLFHEDVPDKFIDRVFAVMALCQRHTFQILTKRPERMAAYMKGLAKSYDRFESAARSMGYTLKFQDIPLVAWPIGNVWLGVSVEDQATADERIPLLLQAPATVRWISAEPLLGPVSFRWAAWNDYKSTKPGIVHGHLDGVRGIDWIVCGGESGPKARPMHPEWARSLRDQCATAGVPFFFKQWGEHLPGLDATNDQIDKARSGGWVHLEGGFHDGNDRAAFLKDDAHVLRVGKKAAGSLLDGQIFKEWPAAARKSTQGEPA